MTPTCMSLRYAVMERSFNVGVGREVDCQASRSFSVLSQQYSKRRLVVLSPPC